MFLNVKRYKLLQSAGLNCTPISKEAMPENNHFYCLPPLWRHFYDTATISRDSIYWLLIRGNQFLPLAQIKVTYLNPLFCREWKGRNRKWKKLFLPFSFVNTVTFLSKLVFYPSHNIGSKTKENREISYLIANVLLLQWLFR